MRETHVTFPCGLLKLEGIHYAAVGQGIRPAVVVCHPHPLNGGSMHNSVVEAVAAALSAVRINALLFNFRGVGGSDGSYGGGMEERKDVTAALDWLEKQRSTDGDKLGVCGYSFGGGVALPVACAEDRVEGVALISPYFEVLPDGLLRTCTKAKLFVTGTEDRVVAPEDVASYSTMAAEPKRAAFINGADHFWGGYEKEMADVVAEFFSGLFG
jgi:uncharacterized protein